MPQPFSHILGQDRVVAHLEELVREGRLPQALLLVGPDSVGKATILRALAATLQCPEDGCGTCGVCRQIAQGNHLDTVILADDGEKIGIETIRALTSRLSLTPQSPVKIALLEDVSRLTREAEAALLKTLEEPTPRTHFLFSVRSLDEVLPTIRSRVAVLQLPLPDVAVLEGVLARAGRTDHGTELLALAEHRVGRLLRYLADPETLEADLARLQRVLALRAAPTLIERFELVEPVTEDREEARAFLRLMLLVLQRELEEGTQPEATIRQIRRTLGALGDLETNARVKLILEDLVVQ